MVNQINLPFNTKNPTLMHIDLNSCFATVEQQANPLLRNKPIAVAAYDTGAGCIIAPSIEAKKLGITVGMRVKEAKLICRNLIILTPDPNKYRTINFAIKKILSEYTNIVIPKSIDEFVIDLENSPVFKKGMTNIAKEIKQRIKNEIGEYLTVSIGIGPNRFLAKTAAGLNKPDGLDIIDKNNYLKIYQKLSLTDLCGISTNNAIRLNKAGIFTVVDFYHADIWQNKIAFQSINAYYWYLRLKGWEIDDVEFGRKSFGNSHALGKALSTFADLAPLLMNLCDKTGTRLRKAGYRARGIHIAISFRDGDFWHKGALIPDFIFDSRDIYKFAFHIMRHCPYQKPVRILAESVFELEKADNTQLALFSDIPKKEALVKAVDNINEKFGSRVITPALMMTEAKTVLDRIAFGGIKELEDMVLN